MNHRKREDREDPRFAGWRDEFDCEQCRSWKGRPPVPIRQATEMLLAQGYRGFRLAHGCHFATDRHGRTHHIPITILETADGQTTTWIPKLP